MLRKCAVLRPFELESETRAPGAIGVWSASVVRRMSDVTQSEPMSQPILARLGFRPVGEIHVLLDRFDP